MLAGGDEDQGARARGDGVRQRLFIAVPLPESLLDHVRMAQAGLPDVPGLRRTRPEQSHVTLAFIGEVGAASVDAAREVVAGVPRGLGGAAALADYLLLPNPGRARVVALAVDDPAGVFTRLFEQVAQGLERAAVWRRESRPFRPHVTIARLRTPTRLRPKAQCGWAAYPVSSVCLYRSELSAGGPRYTVLARAPLTYDDAPEP